MSRPNASRRQLFGAGAAMLLLAPAAAGGAKAAELDGELLRLCAELDQHQAAIDRIEADPNSDPDLADLDPLMVDWWSAVDQITKTRARTPEGVRAKATAVRTAIASTYGDGAPGVLAILGSLLADLIGEPVRLPGMEDAA